MRSEPRLTPVCPHIAYLDRHPGDHMHTGPSLLAHVRHTLSAEPRTVVG